MNKRNLWTTGLVALALIAGWYGRGLDPTLDRSLASNPGSAESGPCPGGAAPLYWRAPMDPSFIRDEPGKSPMGMELVPECPRGPASAPAGGVTIDPMTLHNIGVRTATVERKDLARTVRAVGRVAYDERRVAHAHTKVQGWVDKLMVDFVGQRVNVGQPLLEIYSPQLVATQEELLLALRYRDATKDSSFEDVRGGGASLFTATTRRLALWDVPQRDIEHLVETGKVKRTLTIYAPASGVVTKLGVRKGMEVKPTSNLYTIADLSKLWLLAEVYEYELPWVEVGQRATIELGHSLAQSIAGEVTYIAPFLDPKTRTAEVRIELDNASGELKPEMFGTAVIAASPRIGVVAIPTSAVLHTGTRTLVVVDFGEGRFESREVALGIESGDGWTEVLSGLREGDEIVVSSQFLIDSESNLREVADKSKTGRLAQPNAQAASE